MAPVFAPCVVLPLCCQRIGRTNRLGEPTEFGPIPDSRMLYFSMSNHFECMSCNSTVAHDDIHGETYPRPTCAEHGLMILVYDLKTNIKWWQCGRHYAWDALPELIDDCSYKPYACESPSITSRPAAVRFDQLVHAVNQMQQDLIHVVADTVVDVDSETDGSDTEVPPLEDIPLEDMAELRRLSIDVDEELEALYDMTMQD